LGVLTPRGVDNSLVELVTLWLHIVLILPWLLHAFYVGGQRLDFKVKMSASYPGKYGPRSASLISETGN